MTKKQGIIKGWSIVGRSYDDRILYFRFDSKTNTVNFTYSPLRAYVFGTRKQAMEEMEKLKLLKKKPSYWHIETIYKNWVICSKELPKVYFIDKKDGFHFTTNLDDAMLFETEALALQTLYSFGALSSCNHWKIEWV